MFTVVPIVFLFYLPREKIQLNIWPHMYILFSFFYFHSLQSSSNLPFLFHYRPPFFLFKTSHKWHKCDKSLTDYKPCVVWFIHRLLDGDWNWSLMVKIFILLLCRSNWSSVYFMTHGIFLFSIKTSVSSFEKKLQKKWLPPRQVWNTATGSRSVGNQSIQSQGITMTERKSMLP